MARPQGQLMAGWRLATLVCLLLLASCVQQPERQRDLPVQDVAVRPAQAQRGPASERNKAPSPGDGLYEAETKPLEPVDCGQCHPAVYRALKEAGGDHRFLCQKCHIRFHVADQESAWPRCARCHPDSPHPPPFGDCLSCHVNPHIPRGVPLNDRLTGNCGGCHGVPARQIREEVSAHSQLGCQTCHHDRHGYLPACLECHSPHIAGPAGENCQGCHPPHKPLRIAWPQTVDPRICADCHAEVYATWSRTPSRHGQVPCITCHIEHRYVPACTQCHPQPHSARILKQFPECLTCHLDAHNPPVQNVPAQGAEP